MSDWLRLLEPQLEYLANPKIWEPPLLFLFFFSPCVKLTSSTLRFYTTNGEPARSRLSSFYAYEKFGVFFTFTAVARLRREGRVLRVSAWPDIGSAIGIRNAGPRSESCIPARGRRARSLVPLGGSSRRLKEFLSAIRSVVVSQEMPQFNSDHPGEASFTPPFSFSRKCTF